MPFDDDVVDRVHCLVGRDTSIKGVKSRMMEIALVPGRLGPTTNATGVMGPVAIEQVAVKDHVMLKCMQM
jgi:hypothetical protein